jgi:hypothetical protein
MNETDTERYALPRPKAKLFRRFKVGVLLGIFISASLLLCWAIDHIQDAADRIN